MSCISGIFGVMGVYSGQAIDRIGSKAVCLCRRVCQKWSLGVNEVRNARHFSVANRQVLRLWRVLEWSLAQAFECLVGCTCVYVFLSYCWKRSVAKAVIRSLSTWTTDLQVCLAQANRQLQFDRPHPAALVSVAIYHHFRFSWVLFRYPCVSCHPPSVSFLSKFCWWQLHQTAHNQSDRHGDFM